MLAYTFQLFLSQAITLPKVHLGQKLLAKQAFLTLPAFQSIQNSSLSMPQLAYLQGGLNQNFSGQPHTVGCTLPSFSSYRGVEYGPVSSWDEDTKVCSMACQLLLLRPSQGALTVK